MTNEEMEQKKLELMRQAALSLLQEDDDDCCGEPAGDDGEDDGIFVSSVAEAHMLLKRHAGPSGARYRRGLVRFITRPEKRVYASPSVYHNLLMDMFELGDYASALDVCDFALQLAPQSRDLLADAIRACGESCQFELGEQYLARAMEIPKELWCWRLFFYTTIFLKTKLQAYSTDRALAARAIALADEFIERFPYDEHGYNLRAELDICINERDSAVAFLKHAILEVHPDERDSRSSLLAAQGCLTLLGILEDTNEYDFIIEICDRGLRSTAQSQPSVSIAAFMYRKALALDAKSYSENFRSQDAVLEALKCYQAAYDLMPDGDYCRTIEQRYAALRVHVEESKFRPLKRRALFVDERKM